MLATKGKTTPALSGIDQQDFDKIQVVEGCYPFQIGLQKRIPGKSFISKSDFPIGGIFAFYMVYGRPYILIDNDTNLHIQETPIPNWNNPAIKPLGNSWIDTFSGYSPGGLISRLWAAGAWANGVGVCETIIQGWIDPFLVYAKINTNAINLDNFPQTVSGDSATETGQGTGVKFTYPHNPPDIVLKVVSGLSDNSCEGQGTSPVSSIDSIKLYNEPGDYTGDSITANDLSVGSRLHWNGIVVGRSSDIEMGLVLSTNCPLLGHPIFPDPLVYFLNLSDGVFGQES